MSAAVGRSSERLRQVWAAARLDLLRLRRGRYRMARLFLVGLPVLAASVVALVLLRVGGHPSSSRDAVQSLSKAVTLMWPFSLRFCLFLAAIDVFGGLYRAELADRTLHHLFLQPLRRETVTVGKYLGGLLLLGRMGAVVWILTLAIWLLPQGPGAALATLASATGLKFVFSYLLAMSLALTAYGGLFLLAGMVARGPVLVGAGLWLWEGLAVFLPVSFQRFTVAYWLNSLRPLPSLTREAGGLAMFRQEAAPAPLLLCVLVCLAIGAASVAVAAWWSRSLQLAYGAKD